MKSASEAAEATGLSDGYIRRLCARGAIPGAVKAGEHMWLIPDEWVEEQRDTSDPAALEGYMPLTDAARMAGVTRHGLSLAAAEGRIKCVSIPMIQRDRQYVEIASVLAWMHAREARRRKAGEKDKMKKERETQER